MMKLILPFCLIILFFACSTTEEKSTDVEETVGEATEVEEKTAVCIWDKVAVRETPSSKGKWKTSLSVGEVLTSLGEEAIDTLAKNRKYTKVRLGDGTEGQSVILSFLIVKWPFS